MDLKVKVKDVYGQRLVYPVCDMSKSFAYLVGCKTLPKWATDEIKKMGYTLTVETPELEPDAEPSCPGSPRAGRGPWLLGTAAPTQGQAASLKRQASSKILDRPGKVWDKVI